MFVGLSYIIYRVRKNSLRFMQAMTSSKMPLAEKVAYNLAFLLQNSC